MKTKRSTKLMFALAGSLLAIGSIQAQNRDSLQNLNKNAIQQICPGQGHAAGDRGFWGYAFGDYAYMGHGDSAGRGTKQQYKGLGAYGQTQNQNAFEIRRAYLGYDYKINSKFSAYALMAYEGDQDVSDNRTVYLKYMYFKWKNIFKGSNLKIGQQATNSFASDYNTEPLLGYRSVEKTIMDMHGVDGSSDMGLTLEGRIYTFKAKDTNKVPAFIGYSAMVGDNSGNNPVAGFTGASTSLSGSSIATTTTATLTTTSTTSPGSITYISPATGKDTTITIKTTSTTAASKITSTSTQSLNAFNSTTDKAKKFRLNVYGNLLNSALTIGAYMDYINYGNYYYGTAKGYQHSVMTEKAYIAYNSKWFGIGGEWFMQTYKNGEVESFATITTGKTVVAGAANDTTDAVQTGLSVFAHGTILQNCLNIFARYDMYTPDNKYSYSAVASGSTSSLSNGATEGFASAFSNVASSSVNGNYWKESFMNVGLDWTPTKDKKIHLMPNLWYYNIKAPYGSGDLASSNYVLYRVTFLFAFN